MKILSVALVLLSSLKLAAQAPNTLSKTEKAQGWKLLWDGKTGQGWHTAAGATIPNSNWTIAYCWTMPMAATEKGIAAI